MLVIRRCAPSSAKPFTSHTLAFIVVIADAKVFLEVFPRVCQVVLRLCCDHDKYSVTASRREDVSPTQQETNRAYSQPYSQLLMQNSFHRKTEEAISPNQERKLSLAL